MFSAQMSIQSLKAGVFTAKELFLVFKNVNGGKEAECASLLMIRKVLNKKNPVAPSSEIALLMERGLGTFRSQPITN